MFFGHFAILYHLFALGHLVLVVLLDVTVFARVQPSPREEVVLIRKQFLKALEMDAQGVFPSDIVHA